MASDRGSPRRPGIGKRTVLCALLTLPGCYASNVVAESDRAVAERTLPAEWRAAQVADLDGLFESVEITGDAAVALLKIYYWFAPGGAYSGAALVDEDGGPAFQTLRGSWALAGGQLQLDDADPVAAEAAPEHLRIAAPNGTLVLRRVEGR